MTKRNKYLLAGAAVLVGLLAFTGTASAATSAGVATLSYLGRKDFPRGMRNNNPGNIRISANAWQGKVPVPQNTDGAFEQFTTYVYGIRAMIKNLLTYYSQGLNTLQSIIGKWAPPSDGNNTPAYVAYVAQKTGYSPTQALDLRQKQVMKKIVLAMAEVENARAAVTDSQFNYAWSIV